MNYLNHKYYVELKDDRYIIHPTENIILQDCKEIKSVGTENQVINETQLRLNQIVNKNQIDDLEVKPYPNRKSNSTQKIVETPKIHNQCHQYKQHKGIELDER